MNNNLFSGKLTRLVAADPDTVGELKAKWSRDSEFLQLYDLDPSLPLNVKCSQAHIREHAEKREPGSFLFLIQHLQEERIIGEVGLWDALSSHRNAWVSIAIGERALWGKGYGTDAMQLILGFAFRELNLHRVNLGTFSYNQRAVRSYEKSGFIMEGIMRASIKRDGQRWDNMYMGILRSAWEAKQNG